MRYIVILGPTASGKTELSLQMAREMGGEIINADSRQVFSGLRVATCTPTAADFGDIPHHLFGVVEPGADWSVRSWLSGAQRAVQEIAERGRMPIVVGGTGLYIQALLDNFAFAEVPPNWDVRREREAMGVVALRNQLLNRAPGAAAMIDMHNPRRIIRALEILDAGQPLTRYQRVDPPSDARLIGLDPERSVHEEWIADRARRFFADNTLIPEVELALGRGISAAVLDRCGIGYREAMAVLAGAMSADAARESIVRRTRRYAKAQRTWFRRQPGIIWRDSAVVSTEARAADIVEKARPTTV